MQAPALHEIITMHYDRAMSSENPTPNRQKEELNEISKRGWYVRLFADGEANARFGGVVDRVLQQQQITKFRRKQY